METGSIAGEPDRTKCWSDVADAEVACGDEVPDFGRLRQAVARVVRRWVRCVHLAEDVASEAVTLAWETFGSSLPWGRLVGWTVRVAQRLVIAWHRLVVRRHEVCVEVAALPARDVDARVDLADSVAYALSMLEPRLHDAFRLLVAGATTEEIAAAHGVTIRGARKLVVRLRGELLSAWN